MFAHVNFNRLTTLKVEVDPPPPRTSCLCCNNNKYSSVSSYAPIRALPSFSQMTRQRQIPERTKLCTNKGAPKPQPDDASPTKPQGQVTWVELISLCPLLPPLSTFRLRHTLHLRHHQLHCLSTAPFHWCSGWTNRCKLHLSGGSRQTTTDHHMSSELY